MNLEHRRTPPAQCGSGVVWGLVCGAVAAVLVVSSAAAQAVPDFSGGLHVPPVFQTPGGDRNGTWIGSVTTQGDAIMSGPLARSTFGVNGAGIKVGIISDSFNFLGGMPAGIASGDLPGPGNPNGFVTPVNIVSDELVAGNIDEGRAIAELIHDVAPGAQLMFHAAFNSPETSPGGSIATAINNLVAAGADIIVDDVFNLAMPTYQDGHSAQAANAAFAAGVPYFSSAGNNSNNAYEAMFSPSPAGVNHVFDANANELFPQNLLLNVGSIPDNGSVRATLWWDDPYPTVGGTPTTDYHLGLFDVTGDAVVAGSAQNQLAGADAFEFISFTNTTGIDRSYGFFVELAGGVANKRLKIQVLGRTIQDDDDTNSPTVMGHAAANGAVAVAAAPFFNPNTFETFTAEGPTTILYDTAGNPLGVPEIRATPEITGIDGGNTTFFFADSMSDADAFPNFFGTSASAPHVAAVAALVMQRAAQLGQVLTPTDVYNILFNSTVDLAAPGFDNRTGFGRLDAFAAVSAVIPEPGTLSMLLIAAATSLGFRARRRPTR